MRLLLFLFLLHASLVHFVSATWANIEQSEVYAQLAKGFPDGALLTIYFKYTYTPPPPPPPPAAEVTTKATPTKGTTKATPPPEPATKATPPPPGAPVTAEAPAVKAGKRAAKQEPKVASLLVELYDTFDPARKGCLQFRLIPTGDEKVISNVAKDDCRGGPMEPGKEEKPKSWKYREPKGEWRRFDLLKTNKETFLPFLDGFVQGSFRQMKTVNTNSVHLLNHGDKKKDILFDKKETYVWLRKPNFLTVKLDWITAAFNQAAILTNKNSKPPKGNDFATIEGGLPVSTRKIKVAALMMSNPAKCKETVKNGVCPDTDDMSYNIPKLHFFNKDVSISIENRWDSTNNKVVIRFYTSKQYKHPTSNEFVDCEGEHSGTDLMHFKLERPEKNTIKMRIYYMGSPAGVKCEIKVNDKAAAALDNPLTVQGQEGALPLYMKLVDFKYV